METTSNKTQQSTTENTAAQPTITAEEYTQLSAILERLNADNLTMYDGFFDELPKRFAPFFVNLPTAVAELTARAAHLEYGSKRANSLTAFVASLQNVCEVLMSINDNTFIFDEIDSFCTALHDAHMKSVYQNTQA